MIRVLVGSADPLAAAGLRALLSGLPDVEVAAQASGPLQTAALARSFAPDVIMYDGAPGGADASDLLRRLREAGSAAAVVLLGPAVGSAAVARALREGARGFVPRGAALEEMAAAVRAAADGLVALHPAAVEALLQPYAAASLLEGEPLAHEEPLTAREREVLQLLAQGLANKQIAQRLAISEHTVKFHVGELMAKLGAASRTEAVTRAARRGLLVL